MSSPSKIKSVFAGVAAATAITLVVAYNNADREQGEDQSLPRDLTEETHQQSQAVQVTTDNRFNVDSTDEADQKASATAANSHELQDNNDEVIAPPPPLSIFFEHGGDKLSETAKEQIKSIADYLKESGDTFEIRGCASPDGNEDYNFWLSYRRANAVLDELKDQGVPITQYQDVEGVIGQDRDVYGAGEECPPLDQVDNSGVSDEAINAKKGSEQFKRTDIILNPKYPEPEPEQATSAEGKNSFDLLKFLGITEP